MTIKIKRLFDVASNLRGPITDEDDTLSTREKTNRGLPSLENEPTTRQTTNRGLPEQVTQDDPQTNNNNVVDNKQNDYAEYINTHKINHTNTEKFGDINGHDLFYHPSISRDLVREYIIECKLSYLKLPQSGVIYIEGNDKQFNPLIRIKFIGDRTIVTFRGTSSTNDVMADFYTGLTVSVKLSTYFDFVKDEDDLLVHTGFLLSVLGIYDKLSTVLLGRKSIEYTGHSYGSICCIYAYLRMLELDDQPLHVYTLGSPRMFINDEDYPITRINDKLNIIRFFNKNDIITYLPLAESKTTSIIMSGIVLATGYVSMRNLPPNLIKTVAVATSGIIGASLPFINNFIHVGTGVKLYKERGSRIDGYIGFHSKHSTGMLPKSESYIIVPEGVDEFRDIIGDDYFTSIILSLLTTPLLPYLVKIGGDTKYSKLLQKALSKQLTANQELIGLKKRERNRNILGDGISDEQLKDNFLDLELGIMTGKRQLELYGDVSDLTLNIVASALDTIYDNTIDQYLPASVPKTYTELFYPSSDLTNTLIDVVINTVKTNPIITEPSVPFDSKVKYLIPFVLVTMAVLTFVGNIKDRVRNLFSIKTDHDLTVYLETVSLLPHTIAETKDTDHIIITEEDTPEFIYPTRQSNTTSPMQPTSTPPSESTGESTSTPPSESTSESTSTPPSESTSESDIVEEFGDVFGTKENMIRGPSQSIIVNSDSMTETIKVDPKNDPIDSSNIRVHKHNPHRHSPHKHYPNPKLVHTHNPHSHTNGKTFNYYQLLDYKEGDKERDEGKSYMRLSDRIDLSETERKSSEPIKNPEPSTERKQETFRHIKNGVYKSSDNTVYSSYVSNNKIRFRSHNIKIIGYYPYKNDSELNKLIIF